MMKIPKLLLVALLIVGMMGGLYIHNEYTFEKTKSESISVSHLLTSIEEGTIKVKQKHGVSRGRARVLASQKSLGRRKGQGSRKGAKGARSSKKKRWITKIRALRARLRELRDEEDLDKTAYRMLYNKAKGGEFRNVAHLNDYINTNILLGEKEGS